MSYPVAAIDRRRPTAAAAADVARLHSRSTADVEQRLQLLSGQERRQVRADCQNLLRHKQQAEQPSRHHAHHPIRRRLARQEWEGHLTGGRVTPVACLEPVVHVEAVQGEGVAEHLR